MDINYFDLVASVIILLLGLKGIINGFFKEVFGLIGIIGGIFVASRIGDSVGEELNNMVFNFSSPAAVSFLGFLTTLALFWLLMILLGYIFKKLSAVSGLGPLDKIFGFVFGASKFFLIAAVIAHAAYSIKAVKSTIDSAMGTSILFPIMAETGAFIMKMDPVGMSEDINETIDAGTQVVQEKIQEKIQEVIDSTTQEQIQEIQEKLQDQVKEK